MSAGRSELKSVCVAADTHVHFHPRVDISRLLDHAADNFQNAAREAGCGGSLLGCLFLTESRNVFRFRELRNEAGGMMEGWRIRRTPGAVTVVAENPDRIPIVIVSGRQIQTREGIEVLALGCTEHFGEYGALTEVAEEACSRSWFCVIPWGFGKWSGRRAEIIRSLVASSLQSRVFLGDNAGRLRWTPKPSLLTFSKNGHIPVLAGTDPFPFGRQADRVGSYGVFVEGPVDPIDPGPAIRELIGKRRKQLPVYGQSAGLFRFIVDQVRMQVVKHSRNSP